MLQKVTLDDAIKAGDVKITGSEAKLKELLSYFDNFEFWFNIVELHWTKTRPVLRPCFFGSTL